MKSDLGVFCSTRVEYISSPASQPTLRWRRQYGTTPPATKDKSNKTVHLEKVRSAATRSRESPLSITRSNPSSQRCESLAISIRVFRVRCYAKLK